MEFRCKVSRPSSGRCPRLSQRKQRGQRGSASLPQRTSCRSGSIEVAIRPRVLSAQSRRWLSRRRSCRVLSVGYRLDGPGSLRLNAAPEGGTLWFCRPEAVVLWDGLADHPHQGLLVIDDENPPLATARHGPLLFRRDWPCTAGACRSGRSWWRRLHHTEVPLAPPASVWRGPS